MGWYVQAVGGHDAAPSGSPWTTRSVTGSAQFIVGLISATAVTAGSIRPNPMAPPSAPMKLHFRASFDCQKILSCTAQVQDYMHEAVQKKKAQHTVQTASLARSVPEKAAVYDAHWNVTLAEDFWQRSSSSASIRCNTKDVASCPRQAVNVSDTRRRITRFDRFNGSSISNTEVVGSPAYAGQSFNFAVVKYCGIRDTRCPWRMVCSYMGVLDHSRPF